MGNNRLKHLYQVELKAVIGEKVYVRNYRRDGIMELGTVVDVECYLRYDNSALGISYRVMLDRTSKNRSRLYPNGGKPLFLTVSHGDVFTEGIDL